MQTLFVFPTIVLSLSVVMTGHPGATPSSWRCRAKPVEQCFRHHGRLSSQNGGALKIWLIGTTRVVSVENDVDDMPSLVAKYLEIATPNYSYIFGDFEIAPWRRTRRVI